MNGWKKYLNFTLIICVIFINGCASQSFALRPAPKEGVSVNGLNILFSIAPFDTVSEPGTRNQKTTTKVGARSFTTPRVEAENLRDRIGERLIPQLKAKGLLVDYASIQVIPGVGSTPMERLFRAYTAEHHLLVITPVTERKICSSSCSTKFTLSLSLKEPSSNRELWNVQIEQGNAAGNLANWTPTRNDQLIDDLTALISEVVKIKK